MNRHLKLAILLIGAVLLTACASKRIPTSPAASRTPAPTATAVPLPAATTTAVPSLTSMPAPTSTLRPPSTSTPLPLILQFSYSVSPSQQMAIEELIARFNQTHPEVHVAGKNQGTLANLVSAGNRPDIVMSDPSNIAGLASGGWLTPLDEYMADEKIGLAAKDVQDILPSYIDHYPQLRNRVYSIGFMRSMEVMYYNADLLRAAGFGKPPETWDEFAQVCAVVAKPPDVYCYEMKADATDFVSWVYSRGGDMVSADGRTTMFNKPGLEALTLLNDLFRKRFAITATRAFQEPGDFAAGKVALTFDTTLGLGFYDRAVKGAAKQINWGIAPMPRSIAKPVVALYGPSVAVFKSTAEKQRAGFIFAEWLMDQEPNAAWVQASGYFPARVSTLTRLADYLAANALYATAYDWLPYGRSEPNVAGWNAVRGFLADAMIGVAGGKATPEEALKEAARKANTVLDGR